MMDLPFGVPYTLDQASPFIEAAMVALGFPDIIFQPNDAFEKLLAHQGKTGADIVLGLFPTSQPHKMDMVELGKTGHVRSIKIKPKRTKLLYAWAIALWTPVFTRFMHDYVLSKKTMCEKAIMDGNAGDQNEVYVGDVIQAALQNEMKVDAVIFKDGSCLDIGTPEDLFKASSELVPCS